MTKLKFKIADTFIFHEEMSDLVHEIPVLFESSGVILHSKRNVIKRFDVGDHIYVVKRYKRMNSFRQLLCLLGYKSKAVKAFNNGNEILKRGFSTPQPIAWIEERHLCFITNAYYVCGFEGSRPIRDVFNVETKDMDVVHSFSAFVASLHIKGIIHDDLNSTNTLFSKAADNRVSFSMIDINRMRFMPEDVLPSLSVCLENLTRFTGDMKLFETVARGYADLMSIKFNMSTEDLVSKALQRKYVHDKKWRRRKAFFKHFKRKS